MKFKLLFFSLIFTFSLLAQNKYNENDLLGVWNIESTSENEITFNKEDGLKSNSFGYHFQKDSILIIRTIDTRSQCASPLSYKNCNEK